MGKHNPKNERSKRRYLACLREAMRKSDATLEQVAKALARFENATGYRDFKTFHFEPAIAFKRRLAEQVSHVRRQIDVDAVMRQLTRSSYDATRRPGKTCVTCSAGSWLSPRCRPAVGQSWRRCSTRCS